MKACTKCGKAHARCSAHRRDGEPCGQRAMINQTVCKMHGGLSGQAKQAATRRGILKQAQNHFALPIDVDPAQALLDEVHRTAGLVQWLQSKVNDVVGDIDGTVEHPLVWGQTEHKAKRGFEEGDTYTNKAAVNTWYELWIAERKHLIAVCKAALDAGIEKRRVEIAEKQGELLAAVIRGILTDLKLNATQQQIAAKVVTRHLRAVAN